MRVTEALEKSKKVPPQALVEITRGFSVRRTKKGIAVARLHYFAHPERDPEINPAWEREERKTYSSQASWDREQNIIDRAGGGELAFADTLITHWKKIVITDPEWRPSPHWNVESGFDHGRTNPTALLRDYIDYDGVHYLCGEYYMPGLEIYDNARNLKTMVDINRLQAAYADPSIFDVTQAQEGKDKKAKSINELYVEQGIEIFSAFAFDRSDISFAARLNMHWANLDERKPTLRIVCRNYSENLQPGLHQWDCPNLLWELMRRRRVKLTAQQLLTRNPAEQLVDKDNHGCDACLIKGTLVTTQRGDIPIEDVTTCDSVWTRTGWHRVIDTGMTDSDAEIWRVEFSNGSEVYGTKNHPFWTEENSFSRLDTLKYGIMCLCVKTSTENQNIKHGWELNLGDIQTAIFPAFVGIGALIYACTLLFGYLNIANQSPLNIISIMWIMTALITHLVTYRQSLGVTTLNIMVDSSTRRHLHPLQPLQKEDSQQKHGTHLPKGEHGILSTVGDNCVRTLTKFVHSAATLLETRIVRKAIRFVRVIAASDGDVQTVSTMKRDAVNCVARDSDVVNSIRQDFVHENVQVLRVEKTQLRLPVYNISVEDCPEYFANGILVHNCKYLIMSHPEPTLKTAQQIAQEAVKDLAMQGDLTSAMIRYNQKMEELKQGNAEIRIGRRR